MDQQRPTTPGHQGLDPAKANGLWILTFSLASADIPQILAFAMAHVAHANRQMETQRVRKLLLSLCQAQWGLYGPGPSHRGRFPWEITRESQLAAPELVTALVLALGTSLGGSRESSWLGRATPSGPALPCTLSGLSPVLLQEARGHRMSQHFTSQTPSHQLLSPRAPEVSITVLSWLRTLLQWH